LLLLEAVLSDQIKIEEVSNYEENFFNFSCNIIRTDRL